MGWYRRSAKLHGREFDEAVQKRGMSLPMFGKLMGLTQQIFSVCSKKAVSPQEKCRLRLHSAE